MSSQQHSDDDDAALLLDEDGGKNISSPEPSVGSHGGGFVSRTLFLWASPLIDTVRSSGKFLRRHLPPSLLWGDTVEAMYETAEKDLRSQSSLSAVALLRTMMRSTKGPLLWGFVFFLLQSCVTMLLPLLLQLVIGLVARGNVYSWEGAATLAACAVSQLGVALFANHAFFAMEQGRNRIVTISQMMVFKACLSMPSVPKGLSNTMHNVDPGRMAKIAYSLPRIPVSVIELLVNLTLLYVFVGWAVAATVAVALLLVPILFVAWKKLEATSTKMMSVQDERVNRTTECVEGVLVAKLYSWERPLLDAIAAIRSREMVVIRGYNVSLGLLMTVITSILGLLSIATFVAYSLLGHALTPEKVRGVL